MATTGGATPGRAPAGGNSRPATGPSATPPHERWQVGNGSHERQVPVERVEEDPTATAPPREVTAHARGGVLRSIRLRLMLPILTAAIGLLVLGAIQTQTAVGTAVDAGRARTMASTATATVRLEHEIEQEIAEADALRDRGGTAGAALLVAAEGQTDLAAQEFRSASAAARKAAPDLAPTLNVAESQLAKLKVIRADVKAMATGTLSAGRYTELNQALLAVADALPRQLADPELAGTATSVAAVAAAEHLEAEQRDLLRQVFRRGSYAPGELVTLANLTGARDERLNEFTRMATSEQRSEYVRVVSGTDVFNATQMLNSALAPEEDQFALQVDPDNWYIAQSNTLRRLHQMELSLSNTLDVASGQKQASAQTSALVLGVITGLLIVAVFGAALVLTARTSRRLRRLRSSAMAVATAELPTAISAMTEARDPAGVREALSGSTIDADELIIHGADEVAEVGAALSAMHRQALRLAADQALLRLDIAGLFVALSRRGQTLIRRQIQLIENVQRAEQDPARLARATQLAQMAVKMRRNEENLLVLAGGEAGRRVLGAIPLVDLVAAAAREIDDGHRVQANGIAEAAVAAPAVRDLIHLLAEVLENATNFSPPESYVHVSARRAVDGITITIFDSGIGMPESQVSELNRRLAQPAMLTSELAGTMGLLVVARLAERHGIVVELRSSPGSGTAALVTVPTTILAPMPAPNTDVNALLGQARSVPAPISALPIGDAPAPARPAPAIPAPAAPPSIEQVTTGPTVPAPAAATIPMPPLTLTLTGAPTPPAAGKRPAGPVSPADPATSPAPPAPPGGSAGRAGSGGRAAVGAQAQSGLPQRRPGMFLTQSSTEQLPRRQPGDLLLPGSAVSAEELAGGAGKLRPPDPDTVRARLSGLARGLAAADRRPSGAERNSQEQDGAR